MARAALGQPIGVTQVVHGAGGPVAVPLPADVAAGGFIPGGLADFLTLTVRDAAGEVVLERTTNFCPVSRSRFDPASSDRPVYPDACGGFEGGNPFTLGQVWGIEGGWGAARSASTAAPSRSRTGPTRRPSRSRRATASCSRSRPTRPRSRSSCGSR